VGKGDQWNRGDREEQAGKEDQGVLDSQEVQILTGACLTDARGRKMAADHQRFKYV
jgi:hypothetical protein